MTKAGQVEQRRAEDPRLWLILILVGASLLFASVQKVPWIADGWLCTGFLVAVVLVLLGLLARLALHHPSASSLEDEAEEKEISYA